MLPQGHTAYSSQPQQEYYYPVQQAYPAQQNFAAQQGLPYAQGPPFVQGYPAQAPQGSTQPPAPAEHALEALRAEFTRAVQLLRIDSGEVLLPCELLGDPRNNDRVEFRQRVDFAAPFLAPPTVRLAISSLYADGSGDHGGLPNINGDLDRLLCRLTALDVSERGFTLCVATWHRGHLRPNSRFLWFASASPAWAAAPTDLGAEAPAGQRAAGSQNALAQCAIV
jgi:hypothetical protein